MNEWTRHAVTVPSLTRVVDSWTQTKEGPKRIRREEMVAVHDVYRKLVNGKAQSQLWHRGAKVGV